MRALDLNQGESTTLHIWAQPATDSAGTYKQLQNISLNLVSGTVAQGYDGLLDIRNDVTVVNPKFTLGGNPPRSRFSDVRDSAYVDENNPGRGLELTTLEPGAILTTGTADSVIGLMAANPLTSSATPGVGLGPGCMPGDLSCVQTAFGPVWRLASFSVQSLPHPGMKAALSLQIGATGINHVGDYTAATAVVFALPGQSGPSYNAGPAGDREKTLTGDLPEVVLHIGDTLVGDYSQNGRVDGADLLLWQRSLGSTTNLSADGNGNRVVDTADYQLWQVNFGRSLPATSAVTISVVPEPAGLALVVAGALVASLANRRGNNCGPNRECVSVRRGSISDCRGRGGIRRNQTSNGRLWPVRGPATALEPSQVTGRLIAGAVAVLTFATLATFADATIWWDGGGVGNSWGTAGNWGIGDNNPTAPNPLTFGGSQVVVFNISGQNGSSSSVTSLLDGQRTVGGMEFVSAGSVEIRPGSGGPLRIGNMGISTGSGSNGTLTINANTELTSSQSWSIGRRLIKENPLELGVHTLTLNITNTDVNNESLIDGVVAGPGSIIKNGPGELRLAGNNANTFSGYTEVNAGRLVLNKPEGDPSNDYGSAVANLYIHGGVVELRNGSQIRDNGTVGMDGGILDLGGNSERVHQLFLTNATMQGGGGSTWLLIGTAGDFVSTAGSSAMTSTYLTIGGSPQIDVSNGSFNIASILNDWGATPGGFTKTGTGTLSLTGSTPNSHTGTVTVNAGSLVLAKQAGSPTDDYGSAVGDLVINSGATVQLGQNWQIRDAKSAIVNGGMLNLGVYSERAHLLSLNNGTLSGSGGSTWLAGAALGDTIQSYGTSTISSNFLTIEGEIPINVVDGLLTASSSINNWNSAGSLRKEGAGTLVLAGANSYSGGTSVIGGTLQGTTNSLQGRIDNFGNLVFEQSVSDSLRGAIYGSGTLYKVGAGILSVNSAIENPMVIQGESIQGSAGSLRNSINLLSGTAVRFNQVTPEGFNFPITGQGAVIVTGGSRLDLNHTGNTFSGGLSVNASTVGANGDTLGTGVVTLDGSWLQLASSAVVHNALALSGTGGVVDTNGRDVEWRGNVTGAAPLIKVGGGSLLLTGNNSQHQGGVRLDAGGLLVGNSSLGSGPLTLNAGGLLTPASMSGGQPFQTAVPVTINPGGAVIDPSGNTATFAGPISGAGGLLVTGSGNMILKGTNTHTGGTSVIGGTLTLESPDFDGGAGNVTLGSGATLRYGNHHQIRDASTVTVGPGTTVDMQHFTDAYIQLVLQGGTVTGGTGSAVGVAGPGVFSSGNSTIGTTTFVPLAGNQVTVSDGTLSMTSAITDGVVTGSALIKNGAGTLTLTGGAANTHTGDTIVSGGTLVLNRVADFSTQQLSNFGMSVGNLTINPSGRVRVDEFSQIRNDATVTVVGGVFEIAPNKSEAFDVLAIHSGQAIGGGLLALVAPGNAIASSGSSLISVGAIVPQSPNGEMNIAVGSGALTIQSPILAWSGGSQRLVKWGEGDLLLNGANTYGGGTQINNGRMIVNGSVVGPVTVNSTGTLGGNGTIGGNVSGPGRVAPGNSPGILTINGDFTQSATSVLEIEVGGLTPGNMSNNHDQVRVGGVATLDGQYEFPIINGFVPVVGQEITFIEAFGGGSIAAGTRPRQALAPGLQAADPNLAFRVVASPTDVKLRFVPATSIFFDDGTNSSADWFVATGWNLNRNPTNEDNTTVGGNITGGSQRVTINSVDPATITAANPAGIPVANVQQLLVRDDASPITVGIDAGFTLASTVGDVKIGDRGAIELNGGALTIPTTQKVDVYQSGMLAGDGTVTGAVQVGVTSGSNNAMLSPGMSTAGMEIGAIAITGNYTQGAGGVFEVDLKSAPAAGLFDTLDIVGTAQLGGTLRIDVSQLASLTEQSVYTLIGANQGSGAFDRIEVVDPTGVADDFYFSPFYGTASPAQGAIVVEALSNDEYESGIRTFRKGDADGINGVNQDDARVFSAVLVKGDLDGYMLGPGHSAALNFVNAFDFYQTGAPAGETVIDFDDIPGFVAAMALSQGTSLEAASDVFQATYQEALASAVPEPAVAHLLLSFLVVTARVRSRRSSVGFGAAGIRPHNKVAIKTLPS